MLFWDLLFRDSLLDTRCFEASCFKTPPLVHREKNFCDLRVQVLKCPTRKWIRLGSDLRFMHFERRTPCGKLKNKDNLYKKFKWHQEVFSNFSCPSRNMKKIVDFEHSKLSFWDNFHTKFNQKMVLKKLAVIVTRYQRNRK